MAIDGRLLVRDGRLLVRDGDFTNFPSLDRKFLLNAISVDVLMEKLKAI